MKRSLEKIAKFKLFFKQFYPIKTTQATYIQAPIPTKPKFSRESLNPNVKLEPKNDKSSYIENASYNKFNEKAKENIVQVKINNSVLTNEEKTIETPKISIVMPRPEKKLFQGVRRGVPSSVKKLLYPMFSIRNILEKQETKAALFVKKTLLQVIDHARNKDADTSRLYVNCALIGKHTRVKRMYYHAKSRFGLMKTDRSQLRITLEEKDLEEFWRKILLGEATPGIARRYREIFKENQVGYEKLQNFSRVTTAKGRQQARLMVRRFVEKYEKSLKKKGERMKREAIENLFIGDKLKEICDEYRQSKLTEKTASISKRQAVFKKNEEAG